MDINEIIPYARNARHNKKAIPAVADSIRQFGLRGQIVLESRENPVIVTGHTRVEACKSLGWKEIPDENIAYCDGLTEDEIKAYRIADNKTGEISTRNISMLKSEVKSIGKLDMSKFGCDFKSKDLPSGAHILNNNHGWNMDICNRDDCIGEYELPPLEPCDVKPHDLISFNFCKTATDFNCGVHFCIDDYQFERVWNEPHKYVDLLKKFECVVCPDFSVYIDMPYPMKLWNIYRSRALGFFWQSQGLKVVPNVTWSDASSFPYCFDSLPQGETIFISTVGVTRDKEARAGAIAGFGKALEATKPKRVLLLGDTLDVDFGDIEVCNYKPSSFKRG